MVNGATVTREAGQGRNPAALSDGERVLFFYLGKSYHFNLVSCIENLSIKE